MPNYRKPKDAIPSFQKLAKALNWIPTATNEQTRKIYSLVNDTVNAGIIYNDYAVNLNSLATTIYVITDGSNLDNIYSHLVLWLRSFGVTI